MALNLNIPTLKEKPFIIAETSIEKIHSSLIRLESNTPLDFSAHLRSQLTVLNRQKVPANVRIEALNLYRARTINLTQTLVKEFSNVTLPLHDKAKLSANAVEGLWQELGYGYKLALVDLQNQLIRLSRKKDSILAIQYAIHAISEQALVYFQTYRSIPDSIWADLYQLYFCAVQMGVQHQTNADDSLESWINPENDFSIENAFKLAMLMYLASPQNLSQKEIRAAANYLAKHVQHAEITAMTPLKTTYGAFVIDLSQNQPPEAYSKQKKSPDPHVDILLQTISLVRVVHDELNQLQDKLFRVSAQSAASEQDEDQRNLLTHLIKHLGITPQRQFQRNPIVGELDLIVGIDATHRLSNNVNTEFSHATHVPEPIQPLNTLPNSLAASRWHVINMSATGMCLSRHANAEKNIKVGQLISYKMKDEQHWNIGVVRWAHCGNNDALAIGIQFIAPGVQSAIINAAKAPIAEQALILPESNIPNRQSCMITARHVFMPGLKLKVQWDAQEHEILCTRLVERTQHYDRIQFKLLKSA